VFLVSDCAAGDRRLMKELVKHISNVIVYTLGDSDTARSFVKQSKKASDDTGGHGPVLELAVATMATAFMGTSNTALSQLVQQVGVGVG
jgi:hypothetical protein